MRGCNDREIGKGAVRFDAVAPRTPRRRNRRATSRRPSVIPLRQRALAKPIHFPSPHTRKRFEQCLPTSSCDTLATQVHRAGFSDARIGALRGGAIDPRRRQHGSRVLAHDPGQRPARRRNTSIKSRSLHLGGVLGDMVQAMRQDASRDCPIHRDVQGSRPRDVWHPLRRLPQPGAGVAAIPRWRPVCRTPRRRRVDRPCLRRARNSADVSHWAGRAGLITLLGLHHDGRRLQRCHRLHRQYYIRLYFGPLAPSRGVHRGPSTSVALQSTQFGALTRSTPSTSS